MAITRRWELVCFIVMIVSFCGWLVVFHGNEYLVALGASFFPVIGAVISFVWLYSAFRKIQGKQRFFWLLLSIGVLFYFLSNLIWFSMQVFYGKAIYSDWTFLLWLVAYAFFLAALIYKMKIINTTVSTTSYIFNTIIFMTIAITVSFQYLINPIIDLLANEISDGLIFLFYPAADLSILFVVTCLYYLSRKSKEKNTLLLIIGGFFLQVFADSMFAYQSISGTYYTGNWVEPIWLIALLLIGFAGLSVKEDMEEEIEIIDLFKKNEIIFPYIGVIVLFVLLSQSYQWKVNALSIGVFVIFLVIVGRQLFVMKKNETLMDEYRFLAYHDPLTTLNNRVSFKHELDDLMKKAKRNQDVIALLLIDLDRFKNVNDTLGHHAGDCILKETSIRLKAALEDKGQIFRLGGDEFVTILPAGSKEECIVVAERMIEELGIPFVVSGHEIIITPSIGISLYPDNGLNRDALLKNADAAMYLAKGRGRNSYQFYNAELNAATIRKVRIENGLRKAIENNQFRLLYQPKVKLQSREVSGMEALLRWEHPELGSVSPAEFIPVAEETGQILAIGEWVLRRACTQNKLWQKKGFMPLCVSVNVSVRQFQQSDFVATVRNILRETDLDPQYLDLEITESVMQDIKETTEVLNELKAMGVKTSIDDFGTGYSSLHILKNLPIDTIKIDKTFIDDLGDLAKKPMVKAIIDIGLNLNLEVVAEGIEHEHQCRALTNSNCSFGQGYLFAKPIGVKEFEDYLLQDKFLRLNENG